MSQVDISVLIVTYKSEEVIATCLDSLLAQKDVSFDIHVYDNASGDAIEKIIEEKYPKVHLTQGEKNIGFGAANNRMLKDCQGEYVFYLNPDTECKEGSLLTLKEYLEKNQNAGLVGPQILNADSSLAESISWSYFGSRYLPEGAFEKLPGKIACLLGAAMMASRSLLEGIQGFDSSFFLYGEDQDICLRIRKLGKEIHFCEEAKVMHIGGHSESQTPSEEVVRKKVLAESIFADHHYPMEGTKKLVNARLSQFKFKLMMLKLKKIVNRKPSLIEKEKHLKALVGAYRDWRAKLE